LSWFSCDQDQGNFSLEKNHTQLSRLGENNLHNGLVFHGLRCARPPRLTRASFQRISILLGASVSRGHQHLVGKSKHGSTAALCSSKCLRSAALGFPPARLARQWYFGKLSRRLWGSHWSEVPWSTGLNVNNFHALCRRVVSDQVRLSEMLVSLKICCPKTLTRSSVLDFKLSTKAKLRGV
jgi:hypothetical protein